LNIPESLAALLRLFDIYRNNTIPAKAVSTLSGAAPFFFMFIRFRILSTIPDGCARFGVHPLFILRQAQDDINGEHGEPVEPANHSHTSNLGDRGEGGYRPCKPLKLLKTASIWVTNG
jgi:hypothetical protein